jgi:hypothetical protein
LGDDLRARGFAGAWGAFEEDGFGTVGFVLHAGVFCDLVVDLWVGKGEEDGVLDCALLVLVACEVVPVELDIFVIGIEDCNTERL